MKKLSVFIEINGREKYVGEIVGNGVEDSSFTYAEEYLCSIDATAISISLPLQETSFSPEKTRNFFEGLLPEGFTRRCVANWLHEDEHDYLSILSVLGRECLGAIKIIDEESPMIQPEYRKLSADEVRKLAQEGATESAELVTKAHLSLTGASGKVGLYYNTSENQWYLPIGSAPSTHIVKQSHVRLKKIVANEQLSLLTAKNLGIEIPESFIVQTSSKDEEDVLFATKRYDRKLLEEGKKLNGLNIPYRLHQEDFSQALGIASADKYEKNNSGYLKRMFDLIRSYSSDPIKDQLKLWDICIFNYLVGNTDNHIKNLSLLYTEDLKTLSLAPAYDIVSTMVYERSTENMALSIGEEYNIYRISRESFFHEAQNIGLGTKIAMKHFDTMASNFADALNNAKSYLLKQQITGTDEIAEKILEKGGISNLSF